MTNGLLPGGILGYTADYLSDLAGFLGVLQLSLSLDVIDVELKLNQLQSSHLLDCLGNLLAGSFENLGSRLAVFNRGVHFDCDLLFAGVNLDSLGNIRASRYLIGEFAEHVAVQRDNAVDATSGNSRDFLKHLIVESQLLVNSGGSYFG